MRRSVVVTLTVGLALLGIAIILVPTGAQPILAATNPASGTGYLELTTTRKVGNCQPAGILPQGTSAIRIRIEGVYYSPAVTVKILSGSSILREGQRIPGGPPIPTVTVPVESLAHTVYGARICTTIGPTLGPVRYYGAPSHPSSQADPLQKAELPMEYLKPGTKSWWSRASSIAYNMGLGHAPSGTWIAFLIPMLMLAVVVLISRLILDELR
jgi:hypothetical protein